RLFLFLEIQEDSHLIADDFRAKSNGVFRLQGAVGPHFELKLVVVGTLTNTSLSYGVVHLANWRKNRINGDPTDWQIFIFVVFRGNKPTSRLHQHFGFEFSFFAERADAMAGVKHLNQSASINVTGAKYSFGILFNRNGELVSGSQSLKPNFLDVENDLRHIF